MNDESNVLWRQQSTFLSPGDSYLTLLTSWLGFTTQKEQITLFRLFFPTCLLLAWSGKNQHTTCRKRESHHWLCWILAYISESEPLKGEGMRSFRIPRLAVVKMSFFEIRLLHSLCCLGVAPGSLLRRPMQERLYPVYRLWWVLEHK